MSLLEALLEELDSVPPMVAKDVYLALRTDGAKGNGTPEDPFNASTSKQFDDRLREASEGATLHLGPGVFETTGGAGEGTFEVGWRPLSKQRIMGSGMFATVLRLVRSDNPGEKDNFLYSVVGSQAPLDGFELADLTIDCNLGNLPYTDGLSYARVASEAVYLRGRNIHVHRVRVINFGTRTKEAECFPIYVSFDRTAPPASRLEPVNNVVEDCIIEQPFKENARESGQTVVGAGEFGGQYGDAEVMVYTRGCAIRNCLINYEYANPDPVPPMPAEGINSTGSSVTLQTRWINRLTTNDRIHVRGCSTAAFNGVFAVASVDANAPRAVTYLANGSAGAVAGTITVQKVVKAPLIAKALAYDTGSIAKIETYERHYRQAADPAHGVVGDWIRITGASIADLNGSFRVTDVLEDDGTNTYWKQATSASLDARTGQWFADFATPHNMAEGECVAVLNVLDHSTYHNPLNVVIQRH